VDVVEAGRFTPHVLSEALARVLTSTGLSVDDIARRAEAGLSRRDLEKLTAEERGAAAREEVREQAFLATREIAYRLSRLMQDQPYSGHAQLRELLVTVSSYMEGLGASTGLSSSRVVQSER
jgi:hypothetical protein